MRPPPEWLAQLQARFGAVLRTPLDRSTGTLTATTSAYPPDAVLDVVDRAGAPARERLAVYNRQYWFRLFRAIQTAFPITTRILGPWHLNEHASRFLASHPPEGWDLDAVPDGFDAFLASTMEGEELVVEAARLDATRRRLLRAPAAAPFVPDPDVAARMLDARLAPSPSAAVIVERWPLVDLLEQGEHTELTRLAEPRFWALAREANGIRRWALDPREGELLVLLERHRVRDALARIEAAHGDDARLPALVRQWLARGAERGLWSGLRE